MTGFARTYLELQDEVLTGTFSDTKYRTWVKRWLNDAQGAIVAEVDIRELEEVNNWSVAAAEADKDLPVDYCRTRSVRRTEDGIFLEKLTQDEFDALNINAVGTPTAYTITGTDILWYPVPDAALEIELRYYRWAEEMENNANEPDIPENYHYLLVHYAMARCYERENDYEAAGYHRNLFNEAISKAATQLQHDTRDGVTQVRGMWGSGDSPWPRVNISG